MLKLAQATNLFMAETGTERGGRGGGGDGEVGVSLAGLKYRTSNVIGRPGHQWPLDGLCLGHIQW